MTAKKAQPKKANGTRKPAYTVNIEAATVVFTREGKEYTIPLLPIEDSALVRLAGERMYYLVKGAKDPYVKADEIKAGRPKKINAPITVKAIAEASRRPVAEVLETWRKLSAAEKKKLQADPVVVAAKKRLETPANPSPSDLYLDVFG